MEELT
jgi:hypothetical protein